MPQSKTGGPAPPCTVVIISNHNGTMLLSCEYGTGRRPSFRPCNVPARLHPLLRKWRLICGCSDESKRAEFAVRVEVACATSTSSVRATRSKTIPSPCSASPTQITF